MDGMELVADAKAPAETAAEFAPARAAGIDNARAGGYVSTRQARGSCTQVQGMLYAAVISGTLPLVLLMHHVAFNLPYQVLDLMSACWPTSRCRTCG